MNQMSPKAKGLVLVAILALMVAVGLLMRTEMAHIQVPAEQVFNLFGFPINNTIVASWLAMGVLVALARAGTKRMELVPSRLQNFLEAIVEMLYGLVEEVAGHEKGRRFFPLVATIFLFVLTSNWLGLFPGYGTIGFYEHGAHGEVRFVPLLRSAATGLNTTLALALISVVLTQYFGFQIVGPRYIQRFINIGGGPIGLFVGLLELISEAAKIVSFSFRLFGNIFAGEVLLAVVVFLVPWGAALPFLGLEILVGLIQAFIFAMLTLVFMTIATLEHAETRGEAH